MLPNESPRLRPPSSRSLRPEAVPAAPPPIFCFSIQAAAEPGVMPRVLELFAKRNLVPARWVSHVQAPGQGPAQGAGELTIDLQVSGLDPDLTGYLARCLEQIADVRAVLTSEKARGP